MGDDLLLLPVLEPDLELDLELDPVPDLELELDLEDFLLIELIMEQVKISATLRTVDTENQPSSSALYHLLGTSSTTLRLKGAHIGHRVEAARIFM